MIGLERDELRAGFAGRGAGNLARITLLHADPTAGHRDDRFGTAAAGQLGLPIQGFIAAHESEIYEVVIVLMVWSLYGSVQRALFCAC